MWTYIRKQIHTHKYEDHLLYNLQHKTKSLAFFLGCLPLLILLSGFHNMATTSRSPDSSSPNMNIVIEGNPSKSQLSELGIKSWPKWACPPGKYALRFDASETCYLLKGKVKVYPKGSPEFVEFGAGDLVTIPKGLSCTWDVSVAIDKHYKFDSPSS